MRYIKQHLQVYSALVSLLISMVTAASPSYDLVILGGRVMDPETQYDEIANVGISDGIIKSITSEPIEGKAVIDAAGLVVAPGFIDSHFHAVDPFATKLAVQDGVTTGMDLESGSSSVGEWYADRAKTGWQMNYGTTASHALARMSVHDPEVKFSSPVDASSLGKFIESAALDEYPGWSLAKSNVDQMNQILATLDDDLRQGALGVGVGLAYMQRGVSSYEQFAVQHIAASYGRLSAVHTRFHLNAQTPNEAPIALDEVLANALVLDAPLLLVHDNDYGWWENQEKLRLARSRGHNVWGEYYPFTAGSTFISADFLRPDLWEGIYGYRYEETLYDPTKDSFLSKKQYEELAASEPGRVIVVYMPLREDWLKYWLTIPHMVVASDAMMGFDKYGNLLPYDADPTKYAGHPRTVSSFATTLKLAREQGVPLMFTLSQLSYWTAKHLGDTGLKAMQERGRVQVGKVADLTLFDPVTVEPRATYKAGENGLTSTGIPWVIISGEIVVANSEVKDVKPGKAIRFPVETSGRLEPLSWDRWLEGNSIFLRGPNPSSNGTVDPRDG